MITKPNKYFVKPYHSLIQGLQILLMVQLVKCMATKCYGHWSHNSMSHNYVISDKISVNKMNYVIPRFNNLKETSSNFILISEIYFEFFTHIQD